MLDRASDDRWFVRSTADGPAQAIVEVFGNGWRLRRWSFIEAEQEALGVYTSAELAETAWWRHLDRGRGQRTASASESARRLGED
jgi:hypothetical protein